MVFIVFLLCVALVCVFEFINGFHDTANAVATVIYTKTLKPMHAVILSGLMNYLGIFVSVSLFGVGVAYKIAHLLPMEKLLAFSLHDIVIVLVAILMSSIIWNLFTWRRGIPCSSSHSLLGAIVGGLFAFSYVQHIAAQVNAHELIQVTLSLLISPIIGFIGARILFKAAKHFIHNKSLFHAPQTSAARPPRRIRHILLSTCTLVSFSHGSNDGQKGIGILMIILLLFFPLSYLVSPTFYSDGYQKQIYAVGNIVHAVKDHSALGDKIENELLTLTQNEQMPKETPGLKKKIFSEINDLVSDLGVFAKQTTFQNAGDLATISQYIATSKRIIFNIPFWAMVLIPLVLGLGTTIGRKRIVVTIGEKIGKTHMTYGQGAVSELVAAGTMSLSSLAGLPVSTTHVLSSAVTGSMVASNGRSNLHMCTIRNIAMAWVVTVPVTIALAAVLYFVASMVL